MALDLDGSFQAALKRSEIVAEQNELVVQAEERLRQARGSLLPTINGVASYFRQEQPLLGFSQAFSPASQPETKLTASQAIFRGFRDFAGLREASQLREAQLQAKWQVMLQLYVQVAQAFYSVISNEQDLRNLDTQTGLYQKRIEELQARVRTGRSQASEVLTVQAFLAGLQAQVALAKSQLRASRETFAYVTGLPADTPLRDMETLKEVTGTVDFYLAEVEQRPDVMAAKTRVDAADENVTIAKGAHLPSADLTGNYYFHRTGFLSSVKWDFQATLTIPIFAGGVIQSQVRGAASQLRQTELELSRIRRQAYDDIRTGYEACTADQEQLRLLVFSKNVSERNYLQEVRDYRFGLVANIDVIQALINYQTSVRNLDRMKYTAKVDCVRLEVSAVKRPVEIAGKMK